MIRLIIYFFSILIVITHLFDYHQKDLSGFFLSTLYAGNLALKFSGESGISYLDKDDTLATSASLFRLETQLSLRSQLKNNYLEAVFQFKPEFYGNNGSTHQFKFLGKGLYRSRQKNHEWGIGLISRRNLYFLDKEKIYFDIMQLQGDYARLYFNKVILHLKTEYVYRDFSNSIQNNYDAIQSEIRGIYLSRLGQVGFGWHYERFNIDSKNYLTPQNSELKNSGWRLGPVVTFERQKSSYFSSRYRILRHHSKLSTASSWEQMISLVYSQFITKDWMMFLFVDYIIRDFTSDNEQNYDLAYASTENENRVQLKIERNLTPNTVFFSKLGYQREDLIYQDRYLAWWQVLIGLEFNK